MARSLSLLILVCVFASCGPAMTKTEVSEVMNTFRGYHISEIMMIIGPPNQTTNDGLDGQIYVWSGSKSIQLTNARKETKGTVTRSFRGYNVKSKTVYKPPIIINRKQALMFWVDKDGIIYHGKAKGVGVSEDEQAVVVIVLAITAVAVLIKYQQDQKRAKQWDKWLND